MQKEGLREPRPTKLGPRAIEALDAMGFSAFRISVRYL